MHHHSTARKVFAATATTLTMTLLLAGCAGRGDEPAPATEGGTAAAETCDPGFTDTEVLIGNSIAQSGPAAVYGVIGDTMRLYFDDINAAGGLEFADGKKRKVTVKVMDDGYDPAKTATNVRTLVEQDGVFALAGVLGTGAAISIAPYLEEKGVPSLFAGTGATQINGLHTSDIPWTTAYLPEYAFEVKALAAYVAEKFPGAKTALLYQNDDFGESVLAGFEEAFEGTGVELVASEPYELAAASVDSQITTLANSGADVFLNWATGAFATQSLKKKAELGWDATTVLSSTVADAAFLIPAGEDASKGAVSIAFTKDLNDTSLAGDPGYDAWAAFAAKHEGEINTKLTSAGVGYATAQLLEEALVSMEGCTREALAEAASSFSGLELDLGAVPVSTSPEYPYVFGELGIHIFNGATWDNQPETYTRD